MACPVRDKTQGGCLLHLKYYSLTGLVKKINEIYGKAAEIKWRRD